VRLVADLEKSSNRAKQGRGPSRSRVGGCALGWGWQRPTHRCAAGHPGCRGWGRQPRVWAVV